MGQPRVELTIGDGYVAAVEGSDGLSLACTWCGTDVPATDGFRLVETPSGNHAVFCRLEHLIPWEIKGRQWDEGEPADGSGAADGDATDEPERCAHCDAVPGDKRAVLTRHRGPHTVADSFCSVAHAVDWAKAGGRWQ